MILRIIAALFFVALPVTKAETGLLYFTNFDDFTTGENLWTGQDGWYANPAMPAEGIEGIDDSELIIPGLGKTAFLGFGQPATRRTSLIKPIGHNPITEGSASIEIDTLIAIQDSTNEKRDSFFLSLYNEDLFFLAAIQLTNENQSYRILRDNGVVAIDTNSSFFSGELLLLVLKIDLINNRWSAEYDGIPLFTDKVFTQTTHSRTLGSIAYEWQVTDEDPAKHGNNWMLVADCSVWAIPPGEPEVTIKPPVFNPDTGVSFSFQGEPGWTYQIEYTDALTGWFHDLPGSTFAVTGKAKQISFADPSLRSPQTRFYRVVRTVSE